MTPIQIIMLLDAYMSQTGDVHVQNPAHVEQAFDLTEDGMLLLVDGSKEEKYIHAASTEKGHCFVKHICSLPYPVQKWDMPEKAS